MHADLKNILDKMIQTYSQAEYYQDLLKAKAEYVRLTGTLHEEENEFESRMHSFNDWYLLHYVAQDGMRAFEREIANGNLDLELAKAFWDVNYSLFLFEEYNNKKKPVIKDLLHLDEITLASNSNELAVVEGDLFVGRIACYQNQHYLLNGICMIPSEVQSVVEKKAKKFWKLHNLDEDMAFLLKLEASKNKLLQYGHVGADHIFST
jgi:hypothetical protein